MIIVWVLEEGDAAPVAENHLPQLKAYALKFRLHGVVVVDLEGDVAPRPLRFSGGAWPLDELQDAASHIQVGDLGGARLHRPGHLEPEDLAVEHDILHQVLHVDSYVV